MTGVIGAEDPLNFLGAVAKCRFESPEGLACDVGSDAVSTCCRLNRVLGSICKLFESEVRFYGVVLLRYGLAVQ